MLNVRVMSVCLFVYGHISPSPTHGYYVLELDL